MLKFDEDNILNSVLKFYIYNKYYRKVILLLNGVSTNNELYKTIHSITLIMLNSTFYLMSKYKIFEYQYLKEEDYDNNLLHNSRKFLIQLHLARNIILSFIEDR